MLFRINNLPTDYLAVVEKINSLREQLRFLTSDNRTRWTGAFYRSALAKAIQGSNSIEGYNATYQDAAAVVEGEETLTADEETKQATIGLNQAMTHILQIGADPSFAIDEGTLRSLQFMMVHYDINKHPGQWRPGAIFVVHQPDGETVYTGPDVELVLPLIREFIASLNAPSDLPVQVRGALAHLNLVMIHPFSDGNGRMGRAMQTLTLVRARIVDPVFSSIENYIWQHIDDYYRVLAEVGQGSWHPERDPLPFIRFCLIGHYRQADQLLQIARSTATVWGEVDKLVKDRKLPDRSMQALADALFGFRIRNPVYREKANISEEAALKDLKLLVKEGLLVPHGEKRGRYYVAGETLQQLARKFPRKFDESDPFEELARYAQPDLPGMDNVNA